MRAYLVRVGLKTSANVLIVALCAGLAACGDGGDGNGGGAAVDTATPVATATATRVPPTATNVPTATAIPATATNVPTLTTVPTNTATPVPNTPTATATTVVSGQCADAPKAYASTFAGIQDVIFERRGCTESACHGAAQQGGLDLRSDVAYDNLIEVGSSESSLDRIRPGDKDRSYLFLKLAAATKPSILPPGTQISGAPMPNGLPALSEDELEIVRLWILNGAPKTGTVEGTAALLGACLPPPEPIVIKPLDPPATGEGIQLEMPPWKLEAHSEHEICFATYYDISQQVPPEFLDPATGTAFLFDSSELRQDAQSHHLILNRYVGSIDDINDPSLGDWTCSGGAHDSDACDPTDVHACGTDGFCRSQIRQSFACIGFGPSVGGQSFYAIGGSQTAQSYTHYIPGVYAQIPTKGVLYWNSHAFNLTDQDTMMHARLNYYFAKDPRHSVRPIFDTRMIFAANAPPYTTQTICNDFVLPQGARLFNLSSHTHRHGKHFTIALSDGTQLYESFVYNDPVDTTFNPPLMFDSPDPVQRTLHFCSLYNNGMNSDGSPDPDFVTRRSHVPDSARNTFGLCTPVACTKGKVGAACHGTKDHHTCDTAEGANDGFCDACPITGGESTENEMFILIGSYYLDEE
ncbi:MAG: hypothetical protein HYR72_14250 [Deltaproteobacteria bacterium]|nr:hypothetical protein [Deltaproteobacteria bacterium]MBI3391505.1 hypothetical protein [Deltaproteobacteria bacterium]